MNNEDTLEDGYDSDGDLEPLVKPGDKDYIGEDHRFVLGKRDDGTFKLDEEAMEDEILRDLLEKEYGPRAPEIYSRITAPPPRGRPERFRDEGIFDDSEERCVLLFRGRCASRFFRQSREVANNSDKILVTRLT